MNQAPPSISDSDWRRTPQAVQALVVNLLDAMERVAHLEQVVEQQAARIASLETKLARRKGRGSGGARASSSESASQASRRSGKRRSSGRSPGGQPGHEGHGRSLVSVEQVDELPIKPSTCRRCGQALCGDDPHPLRHQEVVIPPVRTQVIEYQFHTLRCRHCSRGADCVQDPQPNGTVWNARELQSCLIYCRPQEICLQLRAMHQRPFQGVRRPSTIVGTAGVYPLLYELTRSKQAYHFPVVVLCVFTLILPHRQVEMARQQNDVTVLG